jgi:uncharacterized membrane protein YhaH (DUF805 family)
MSLGHYLFGFGGRINRAKQWAVLLVSVVHVFIVSIAFGLTVGYGTILTIIQGKTSFAAVANTPQAFAFGAIFGALYVLGLYIGLAVMAKRLHDRNRSAWWILVFFVAPLVLQIPVLLHMPAMLAHMGEAIRAARAHLPPPAMPFEPPLAAIGRGAATILSLWAFVELFILRGTVGDNRYGPDPLAGRG